MPTEPLTFTGRAGRPLEARLETPGDSKAGAFALFAHCFTCGKDGLASSRIARALATRGVATLRFDFTGLGGGDDAGNPGFSGDVEDLRLAARFMTDTGRAPTLLVGHSLGGAAVLAAAAAITGLRAVATIGAPADAAHVLQQFPEALPNVEADGDAVVTLGGRPFTVTRRFVEDVRAHDLQQSLRALRCGLLILHSPVDAVVAVADARTLFDAARHPRSFVSLPGADHLLTGKGDADYAAGVIAAWADRYLSAPT